jgi:glucose/arabinose dehydrogenase
MKKSILIGLLILAILTACQPTPPSPTVSTQPATATQALPTPIPIDPTYDLTPTETGVPPVFEPVAALQPVAEGLTAPVALTAPDDGTGRLFVVDQIGIIFIIDATGTLLDTPFLDLRNKIVTLNSNYDERGLLGLAFHPDYIDNGRFFVYYSATLRTGGTFGWNHTSVVAEYQVSANDPNLADPNSEKIILQVDQPQANHNSGAIAFGPDNYLYIPLGDGGGADDQNAGHARDWYAINQGGNGQDLEANPLGSILRIDINQGDPYSVPTDNPDLSVNYPETWAYGFRNPYRMAFDPGGTHELFVGDAGQDLWEEVSIVQAGGNYGWNVREGTHCFSTADPETPDAINTCPTEDPQGQPLIDPIIQFANSDNPQGGLGASVIGGVVYRGTDLPAWDGKYIFGQWSLEGYPPRGGLFVATRPMDESAGLWDFVNVTLSNRQGGELGEYLLGFGQDNAGEVYVLSSGMTGPSGNTGQVFRLIPPE